MRTKQANPKKKIRREEKKKRVHLGYDRENLLRAFNKVKDEGWSMRRAAKCFDVPETTLRDRVAGRVKPELIRTGAHTLFTEEEELTLVKHIETMAEIGYGMTYTQLRNTAGDLAATLGRRVNPKDLSNNWVYRFLNRWSHRISSMKPQSLESTRAKATTQETIDNYYNELENILIKYELVDKPHMIFNLDETGLKPEHKPLNILASNKSKPNTTTSPKGNTVTLYGCVSATGQVLPPFFVFKGVRANEALLREALPGTSYAMSETGWGNSDTFVKYLRDHFLKFTQAGPAAPDYTLLLFDGHGSHITKQVIDMALENKIVMFVLPPHTSHLTQPLDVGCFGPFKRYYYSECDMWMKTHMGQTMTRYEVCEVACKAYPKAMTYNNITSSFKKCGIYPLDKKVIPIEKTFPSEPFREKQPLQKVMAIKGGPEEVEKFLMAKVEDMQLVSSKETTPTVSKKSTTTTVPRMKKPLPGGKAITEDEFKSQLEEYETQRQKEQTKSKAGTTGGKGRGKKVSQGTKRQQSPKPSTSGVLNKKRQSAVQEIELNDTDSDIEIEDSEKCCVCNKYEPEALKEAFAFEIVKWANCTKCGHWVHLKYCTKTRCIRLHSEFYCMHCTDV